jgi:MFS family permease
VSETRGGFFAGFEASEKRFVFIAATIAMLRMFGVFALLPVLSVHAATLADATPFLIGMAVGAYGLTQAGMQIPLGALSDRIGRRPVIAGALLLLAAGSVVAAVSDTIYGVILGRLLQGAGAISAALVAFIADATRESVRTRSMALYGIGFGVSFMVAVVAGPVIAANFGVDGVFWVAAGAALAAILMLFILPDVARPKPRASYSLRPAFRPDLLRLDLYVFLLHAILTASFVALPFLFGDRLGLAMTDHWMMYLGALALSLAITVPLIMRDDRQGRTANLRIAIVLIAVAELGFAFLGFSTVAIFLALALFFGGFNFLEAGLPSRLSGLADDAVRGASLGVFSTAQFLGIFTGGLLGGRFLASGTPAVFVLCALLAATWLAIVGIGGRDSAPETVTE